ncbi:hypothetical protein KTN4_287 [Pseudomonas phage KTN4]|uniref:Uncharacterized protein n=1 Tax=Pseudomonas phage KTN4 TaxID=1862701 RepID=A0A192Y6W3_9CAUD|nr:hypothetical protein KTN4_287 [Pseudomonas phage KTN4]
MKKLYLDDLPALGYHQSMADFEAAVRKYTTAFLIDNLLMDTAGKAINPISPYFLDKVNERLAELGDPLYRVTCIISRWPNKTKCVGCQMRRFG